VRKYQRDFDGVIAVSKSILDRDPQFTLAYNMLTTGYFCEHRYPEYLEADSHEPGGDDTTRDVAKGNLEDARRDLQRLIEQARAGLVRPSHVVHAANNLHDRALTLEWLEKSYEHHDYWELFINVDPEFDWLHSEPRFQALVHKLGVG